MITTPSSSKTPDKIPLCVELIPKSAWCKNLRSELTTTAEWALVKQRTYREANYHCEACGGWGQTHPVECHERWEFDEVTRIQRLVRTIALCPACHESTHFGFARTQGREIQAKKHLMEVTGWDLATANQHIAKAMRDWLRRGKLSWQLDVAWLFDFVPISPSTRTKIKSFVAGA